MIFHTTAQYVTRKGQTKRFHEDLPADSVEEAKALALSLIKGDKRRQVATITFIKAVKQRGLLARLIRGPIRN